MAGFILGTGSGVLAAAATYYTLSTHLTRSTIGLTDQLDASARDLNDKYDTTNPPAPSSFVGPSRHAPPAFSDLLRQRWNNALSSAFSSVRETDYTALGLAAWDGSRQLISQVSGPSAPSPSSASTSTGISFPSPFLASAAGPAQGQGTPDDFVRDVVADARAATHEAGRLFREAGREIRKDAREFGEQVREAGEEFQRNFEREKDRREAMDMDRGSVREETYVGGLPEEVKARRKVEQVGPKRLV